MSFSAVNGRRPRGRPPLGAMGNIRVGMWGQSNNLGVGARSEIASSPLSSDPQLAVLDGAAFSRVFIFNAAGDAYEPLENGVNQQAFNTTKIGPEFGLAVRWMRETSSGNLYIDKQSGDGFAIAQFQSGTAFFTTALARRSAADAWLDAELITATDSGWLWVQGESNYLNTEASYSSALSTLISSRISQGLLGASERVVLAQVNATNNYYGSGVAAAKTAWVTANPTKGRTVTYANYLNADNVHLSARGAIQLGYDAFSSLFDVPTVSA